jgi:hypothetical protein
LVFPDMSYFYGFSGISNQAIYCKLNLKDSLIRALPNALMTRMVNKNGLLCDSTSRMARA